MFSIVARVPASSRLRQPRARECAALATGACPRRGACTPAPIVQRAAAAIQTPLGDTASPAPPRAGPSANPTCHERAFSAMYRPMSRGSARSAASGPATAPWRHWPIANTTITTTRTTNAVCGVAAPAIGTRSHAPAQSSPKSASVGMRRRPRASRAIGSCVNTMTSVLTRNRSPICVSSRPASFFA